MSTFNFSVPFINFIGEITICEHLSLSFQDMNVESISAYLAKCLSETFVNVPNRLL